MIKNRISALESKRVAKTPQIAFFQFIKSKKDLRKAIKQIKRAKKKYPNSRIPLIRVFAAGALEKSNQKEHDNGEI